MGSFVLCVMLISFLQMRQRVAINKSKSQSRSMGYGSGNAGGGRIGGGSSSSAGEEKGASAFSWNLGSLLLDFLHLYGVTFNYNSVGISIRDGGTYFRKEDRDGWSRWVMGSG
jgi:DNA polymerase sigma